MVFDSVYEMFNPLTDVRKQHFWEWFSGKSIDSKRWNLEAVAGSIDAATGMYDGVDFGFYIKNSSNSDHTQIDFDDKKQYSTNCQMIVVH